MNKTYQKYGVSNSRRSSDYLRIINLRKKKLKYQFCKKTSDLPWVSIQKITIDKFDLWHECYKCKKQICDTQMECCQSSNFLRKYKVTMTMSCKHGEFMLISKEMDVVRVLLYAEMEAAWDKWNKTFQLIRTFCFDQNKNYIPSEDSLTPVQVQALKQRLSGILKKYSNQNHYFDFKFRITYKSARNKGDEMWYYCLMARYTGNSPGFL